VVYRRTDRVIEQLVVRRDRILAAARDLVTQGGLRAAHITAIAAAADLAAGTIYRYFPSKADLFAEVLGRIAERELAVISAIVGAPGRPRDRLAAMIRVFVTRAIRGRQLARALIIEPADVELEPARLAYRQALGRQLEAMLREGIAAGDFPPQDVAVTAAYLLGGCIEALVGALAPERPEADDQASALAESVVGFCVRAVGTEA
jgi:AcrR family transcriptional regulator